MRRDLPVLCAVLPVWVAASGLAFALLGAPETGVDDADIFLTYARNLVDGRGLVFNAGGERVEGFTSLLWMLLCAGALLLGERPERLLLALSVGLSALAVAAAVAHARRETGSRAAALLAGGWSLLPPHYVTWTTVPLMDTTLYAAVLCVGSVAVARAAASPAPRRAGGVALALAALLLTRPEGMAVGVVWLLALGVGTRLATGSWRAARARVVLPAASYGALLVALTGFRLAYFGDPLPNTFYAKVSPDPLVNLAQGAAYLRVFAAAQPLGIAATATALAAALLALRPLRRGRAGDPRAAALFAIATAGLAGIAIPVAAGGDHFALLRAFQPVWPILVLPALLLAGARLARARPVPVALASTAALAAMLLATTPTWWGLTRVTRLANEFALARAGRGIADALNRLQPAEPRLSLGVAVSGGFGYVYAGEVVDLLGLNHRAMGRAPGERRGLVNHAAFHRSVFWQLAPELVFPDGAPGVDPRPLALQLRAQSFENRVTRGLLRSARFLRRYAPVSIGAGPPGQRDLFRVVGWCRRDAVPRLRRRGLSVAVFSLDELTGADLSGLPPPL